MRIKGNTKKTIVVFTRWSRKAYAVFASLSKELVIGHLKLYHNIIISCSEFAILYLTEKTDTTVLEVPDNLIQVIEAQLKENLPAYERMINKLRSSKYKSPCFALRTHGLFC